MEKKANEEARWSKEASNNNITYFIIFIFFRSMGRPDAFFPAPCVVHDFRHELYVHIACFNTFPTLPTTT